MFQIRVVPMLKKSDENQFAQRDIIGVILGNYYILNNLWHACVLSLTQQKKITIIITSVQQVYVQNHFVYTTYKKITFQRENMDPRQDH